MKRILVDENLPPSLVRVFSDFGIEAWHVYDLDLQSGPDRAVWAQASILGAAVATKDSDFQDIAALSGEARVILFQVGNTRLKDVIDFTQDHLLSICSFLDGQERVLVLSRLG